MCIFHFVFFFYFIIPQPETIFHTLMAPASSVAVPDRDATGSAMSDDETILQVISPLNNGDGNE